MISDFIWFSFWYVSMFWWHWFYAHISAQLSCTSVTVGFLVKFTLCSTSVILRLRQIFFMIKTLSHQINWEETRTNFEVTVQISHNFFFFFDFVTIHWIQYVVNCAVGFDDDFFSVHYQYLRDLRAKTIIAYVMWKNGSMFLYTYLIVLFFFLNMYVSVVCCWFFFSRSLSQ